MTIKPDAISTYLPTEAAQAHAAAPLVIVVREIVIQGQPVGYLVNDQFIRDDPPLGTVLTLLGRTQ